MACKLCGGKGIIMVKGYKTDKYYEVDCSLCGGNTDDTKKSAIRSGNKKEKTCGYCEGAGEVTVEASDGSPRICTCGHCNGSGHEPKVK